MGALGVGLILAGEREALFALRFGDIAIHLAERLAGLRQAGVRGAGQQRIGARPVLLQPAVAVEQHRAVDQLAARIAARGGFFEPRRGLGIGTLFEQHAAVIVLGLKMALLGGLAIPILGLGLVDRHPLAEPIGLAEVELGIGIATGGGALPILDRGL